MIRDPASRDGSSWTRDVRRCANVAALAVTAWLVLFGVSSELEPIRARSPWSEDPWDAVVSLAMLLVIFVTGLTFVRVQRRASLGTMPAVELVSVERGVRVVLLAMGAALAAGWHAVASGQQGDAWDGTTAGLVVGLAGTTILVGGALGMLVLTSRRNRTFVPMPDPGQSVPDVFDDLSGSLRVIAGATARLRVGGVLERLARTIDDEARTSRFSPRRRPTAWAAAVAVLFGVGLATWHGVAEGLGPDQATTIRSWVAFATFGASAVLAGWIVFGRYLGLVRRYG